MANSGLGFVPSAWAPTLPDLPVEFDCEVAGEICLGTHVMFLGEVRQVRVRGDVEQPIEWCPWGDVVPAVA